jgi:ATP-dependent Clp protease ATP-binding subunit ClpC
MFERYNEGARRVVFFARYEASSFGSPYIETEHILLGILREDKALTSRFLGSRPTVVESIRKQIEAHTGIREKISTSVDLPLSTECKRVLASAAQEMERLGHRHLGPEHLLVGLLQEEKSFAAALLNERGVKLDAVRKDLERRPKETEAHSGLGHGSTSPSASSALSDFARDLTQAALEAKLDPLVGRQQELDAVIEILSRRLHRNPILIGERGVGKSAIVEGLAQHLSNGGAHLPLASKRIMALDAALVAGWALNRRKSEDRLNDLIKAMIDATDVVFYIDDLGLLIASAAQSGSFIVGSILKHWLLRGTIQCIGACAPRDYARAIEIAPWIPDSFRAIHLHPLDADTTLSVLQSRKHHYETFHGVKYADDALEFAANSSAGDPAVNPLPGKALDLLDAAGARVRLRQGALPAEIVDVAKRLKQIVVSLDRAVASHEFEKARLYSDEERRERENLRLLREKYHLEDAALVTRADVEEVIARAASYPFVPG